MENDIKQGGYLYIISNPDFPDYCKIGITENISDRLSVYQTSSPHRNYKVEYYIFHPKYKIAEKKIKEMMKYFSTDTIQKGEWFKISLPIAKVRLDETLLDYNDAPDKY